MRCHRFNTQPPEGGCLPVWVNNPIHGVSTHSRPKAAALRPPCTSTAANVSTHSRPKAAADMPSAQLNALLVSTHSRPKAAAALHLRYIVDKAVSTHSRPKAAAHHHLLLALLLRCFNTQPPEGGCFKMYLGHFFPVKFQHTAARRRLHTNKFVSIKKWKFQHTAARRRLPITFTVGAEGLMFQHTAARRRLLRHDVGKT